MLVKGAIGIETVMNHHMDISIATHWYDWPAYQAVTSLHKIQRITYHPTDEKPLPKTNGYKDCSPMHISMELCADYTWNIIIKKANTNIQWNDNGLALVKGRNSLALIHTHCKCHIYFSDFIAYHQQQVVFNFESGTSPDQWKTTA